MIYTGLCEFYVPSTLPVEGVGRAKVSENCDLHVIDKEIR